MNGSTATYFFGASERTGLLSPASIGGFLARIIELHVRLAGDVFDEIAAEPFGNWHVDTTNQTLQLRVTKSGEAVLGVQAREVGEPPARQHDRAKARLLLEDDPVLVELGISDREGRVKPSRRAKYRQVEEFLRELQAALDDAIGSGRLHPSEADPLRIVDLGCGNGELARALAERGHRGPYLGVDFSLPLLRAAGSQPEGFATNFMQADLTQPREIAELSLVNDTWDVVTAFAVLHHIPSMDLRLDLLRVAHRLLKTDGMFVPSNWQFLNSDKLRARIQPWKAVNVAETEVDAGDYLLDWRSGGNGLRYVHHFDEHELKWLAGASNFKVVETFYADGDGGRLGLYQVWKPL